MKSLQYLLVFLFACCLSGCFEMNEEITIAKDGSGTFSLRSDFGKSFSMLSAMMKPEDMEKAGLTDAKDTTISMKDLLAGATSLTDPQRAVLGQGTMRLQINSAEQLFKLNTQYPFTSLANLQQLYQYQTEGMNAFMQGMASENTDIFGGGASMKQISSYFDMVTTKRSIARKLNKEKYAALAEDQMMQQMKQMSALTGAMGEPVMNTLIHLTEPAKKITGANAELSADKKTVTIKNNLLDIFDHPEVFEYSIEY